MIKKRKKIEIKYTKEFLNVQNIYSPIKYIIYLFPDICPETKKFSIYSMEYGL